MPRFIVDADTPRSSVQVFKDFGQDALHVQDVGLRDANDDIFAYAQAEGRIIVSRDLDWSNLLDYPLGSHCGIVVLRVPPTFKAKQNIGILSCKSVLPEPPGPTPGVTPHLDDLDFAQKVTDLIPRGQPFQDV
jgi:predicted nuclease of predicted toxin-antitoxin system